MEPKSDNELLLSFIQLFAIVSTVGIFLIPLKTILGIIENKSVGSVAGIQFLSTSLNCFLWVSYSLLTSNGTMLFTNSIGLLFSFYYVYNYWLYCGNGARDYLHKIMVTCILAILMISVSFIGTNDDLDLKTNRLGFQASIVSIVMFASPLEKLIQIIKIKNSEGMLKGVAVAGMMCSGSWFFFGLLIDDKYIYVPNSLAFLLALTQLMIIFKYPPSPSPQIIY